MREIKFNFIYGVDGEKETYFNRTFTFGDIEACYHMDEICDSIAPKQCSIVGKRQYLGLKDINGNEFFVSDIGEFENGDRFVLRMEPWLEVFIKWIGEPECEDQARDLYRIERARIIGNELENPELLENAG